MEEPKISSNILWRARLEVCQMDSHMMDIVADGTLTRVRGEEIYLYLLVFTMHTVKQYNPSGTIK